MSFKRDKQIYTRLLSYLKPYQKRFIISVVASIPASAINGATAWVVGPFIDKIIKPENYTLLLFVPIVIIAASLIQGLFDYLSQYHSNYVSNRVSQDIQFDLYKHLVSMDLHYFKSRTYGDILTRYYADANKLQQAVVSNLQGFIIQIFTMIFLAGVLFYRNWQLSILAILIISLIVFPLNYVSKRIRKLDYVLRETTASIGNIFNETIYGVREIKSFQLDDFQIKRFLKVRNKAFDTLMSLARKNIILSPLMQLIASVGIGTIIFLGSMYVKSGHMTTGDLASFLLALLLLYKPVKVVGSMFGKLQFIFAPAERVFQVMDVQPNLKEAEHPVEIQFFESLVYENVGFRYAPDKQVLKDINFSIQAGEVIAIVGGSGGGKSTLVDMIPRFIDPSEGRILLNGIEAQQLSFASLRSLISLVSQETLLFNGSIRENVLLGRLDATEAEVQEALRVAHLSEWIASLPKGLETPVGDRGGFLSGGQKQRLAIARAFLKNAPILILDEATSALDNESEAIVQDALLSLMQGRTVIMIAHRLSTLKHADRIIVIEAGRMVETGTHQDLLAQQGIYHKLYTLQFRDHEVDALLPVAVSG